jgi:GT2 family glycosyltransferase
MNLDILVLTHNRLDVTKRFLDCLYESTPSFELYLLDNGSTDGTAAYLNDLWAEQANITLVLQKENLGVIRGRNELYEMWKDATIGFDEVVASAAPGDAICFLDNDQFVQRGWVDSYAALFAKGYDLVGWEAWLQRSDDEARFYPLRKAVQRRDRVFNYVGCGGMMMRPEVPGAVGMFDTAFSPAYFEDPDFNYRAFDAGFTIGWNPTPLIVHEAHSTLGRSDWYPSFRKSYKAFRDKWTTRRPPEISCAIA